MNKKKKERKKKMAAVRSFEVSECGFTVNACLSDVSGRAIAIGILYRGCCVVSNWFVYTPCSNEVLDRVKRNTHPNNDYQFQKGLFNE